MAKVEFTVANGDGKLCIDGHEVPDCTEFSLHCIPGHIPIATVHLAMDIQPDDVEPSSVAVEAARVEYMVRELTTSGAIREYRAIQKTDGDWRVHPVK